MSRTTESLLAIVVVLALAAGLAWAGSHGSVDAFGWPLFALCGTVAFTIQWVAFVPSWLLRTERHFDAVGSLTYLTLVALALALGERDARSLLVGGLVAIWALRLGSFLLLRILRSGKDERFDQIKQSFTRLLMSWTLQGLWVYLTFAAGLAAMTSSAQQPLGALAIAGTAVWLLGFGVEVVADRQKQAFKRSPENEGAFIRSGLWAWSRHPNYAGEITLWTGIALIALPALSGWQLATLISPLFVYVLLTRISGIPMLERRGKKRWGDDPEYRRYVANTPVLWPRPPGDG